MHRQLTITTGKALAHDADGKLRNMHVQARACVFGAQFLQPADPGNEAYRSNIESAISIAKKEREGWCAIKTQAFPDGDFVGAGKAAMFISGLYMELDHFTAALAWCVQAARDFRKTSSTYDNHVNTNMDLSCCTLRTKETCTTSSVPSTAGLRVRLKAKNRKAVKRAFSRILNFKSFY